MFRSKIALLASEGKSNPQIIAATGAAYTTVSTWRNRFYNSTELIEHAECGTEVYSTDEMTGVQALERKYPDRPVCPGCPALHGFEYVRHGTLSLIAFLRIADGVIHAPYINQTRNEQDFCDAVRQLIKEDPEKGKDILCTSTSVYKSRHKSAGRKLQQDKTVKIIR